MALNHALQELVDNQKVGFEDVFELYAALCVDHVRAMTNELIADEGIERVLSNLSGASRVYALTVAGLTAEAVNWAQDTIPEMIGDSDTYMKMETESFLEYTIRRKIEMRVEETNAFQIKLS